MNRATLFVIGFACGLFSGSEAQAGMMAGISVRSVTPTPLLPVSGGVGPSHPVKEARGDLTVRALVLEQDGLRVGIISTDFLGFPRALGDRIRNKVAGIIPGEQLLIGATHTHSAPDCYGFPDGKGGTSADLKYLAWVCDQAADALTEAWNHRVPVEMKIATGEAKGQIAFNYYAPELYDRRCHVMQWNKVADGKPVATLVNYAIHPEVLGADAGILSPDLIGPLYETLENLGGGTGIFMNGAQGGMVTADNRELEGEGERRDWKECVRIGTLLGQEAMRLISSAPSEKDPLLKCWSEEATFAVDSPMIRGLVAVSPLGIKMKSDNTIQTQINVLKIGSAWVLTIPGEALPNIGFYLKRKLPGDHGFLFGLTNDAFGYILTPEDWGSFRRYDYVSRTSLGEMTGRHYIDVVLKMVDRAAKEINQTGRP